MLPLWCMTRNAPRRGTNEYVVEEEDGGEGGGEMSHKTHLRRWKAATTVLETQLGTRVEVQGWPCRP